LEYTAEVFSHSLGRAPSYAADKSGHFLALTIERQVIGALLPDSGQRPKVGFGRIAEIAHLGITPGKSQPNCSTGNNTL
jgi:hypothetical protein